MTDALTLLLRLTLCGGAVSLLCLTARPALKKISARWRRLAAAIALLFFLLPFPPARLPHSPGTPPLPPDRGTAALPEYAADGKIPEALHGRSLPQGAATVILALWLGGGAILLLYRAVKWNHFSDAVLAGSHKPDEALQSVYENLCRDMGIRHSPELLCCGGVGAPMLSGVFRPRLLLPGIPLGRERLRLVLRHELTHYRSGDTVVKLAAMAISLLHWWNPLAYLPGYLFQADCESACDERLALSMDARQRRVYGLTILELMSCAKTPLDAPFSRKRELKGRLEAILRAAPPTRAARLLGALAALALILSGIAASSLLAYAIPAPVKNGSAVRYLPYYDVQPQPSSDSGPSFPPLPKDAETRLVTELLSSVSLSENVVRFTIPAEKPPLGKDWYIHISGRTPDGFSLHWLERESDGFLWEPGKTYTFPLNPAAFLGESEAVDIGAVYDLCQMFVKIVRRNPETGEMTEYAGGQTWPAAAWAREQEKL